MATTWRLKATRGHGWVEHLDPDGRVAITADPRGARQWHTLEAAERAAARVPAGRVPVEPVAGAAFEPEIHGRPA